jgi:hypothetical protein
MFATLTGPWPRAFLDGRALADIEAAVGGGRAEPDEAARLADALVEEVLGIQASAGLELLSDGQVRVPDLGVAVAAALDAVEHLPDGGLRLAGEPRSLAPVLRGWWAAAAARTDRPVKQALPGPYSLGRRLDPGALGRPRATLALADALATELAALAEAGCPLVEVEEPAAVGIGSDEAERELFREAQRRLLTATPGLHATLAVTGGAADGAGAATILDAPYHSYLFDLIAGPDNWRLIAVTPGERGVVCGALRPVTDGGDDVPDLVWAARYAASTRGRGPDRVGLANASALVDQSPSEAARRVTVLGRAAAIVMLPVSEAVRAGLDPRSLDLRSAALGRYIPPDRGARSRRGSRRRPRPGG